MSNGPEPANGGFSQAMSAMAEAERLINDEAQATGTDRKKSKNRTRNILNSLNRVGTVLERVGALHPAAQLVFGVYKGLLKLENDRRDNSEQIVVLFHSMARMLSVLAHLEQVALVDNSPITIHLGHVLYGASQTMEEFGDLSDLYYNKCKQPVVRFLKAGEFKGKIRHFEKCFSQHRSELQEILVVRNEVRGGQISQEIEQLRINTERIIARLGEPVSEQEASAIELVRECGRDRVLHDKAKLEELSSLVGGGKVSGNTQALLDMNLDQLLSDNMDQFHRKLDSSMSQINESVNKSRDAILRKLDSGPHELIEDPDVSAVWQSNAWKLSVKSRHFVDELSNHYEEKFRNETATEGANTSDHWTLPIFSKVMYHPSIGDAIDEDGSGFISVYEVNCWLKDRPNGWSVPEWLVYWAIGWKMNNVRFNEAVVESLEDIREKCTPFVQSEDVDVQHQAQQYLSKIQILEKISSWSDSADAEDTQDLSHEAEAKLQDLLDQSSKAQVQLITGRLEELKWILDDPADLPVLLGGSDARIEQVFLSIAHLILGKQLEELSTKELGDGDWETMTETLHMLIGVFHERMQSLLRGWRAQKLNVELNITCFAGGIYNGWYTAYYNPNGEMKRILENSVAGHKAETQESSQSDTLETLLTQISNLTERVDHVDSRIDDILSMLQTLVAATTAKSTVLAEKKADIRNSLLGIHLLPPGDIQSANAPRALISDSPASVTVRSLPPIPTPIDTSKTAQKIKGHAKSARRMMEVGNIMYEMVNSPDTPPEQVSHPQDLAILKEPTHDGDEFDFIVDGYAAPPDGVEFPRMPGIVSRSQTAATTTSPETDQSHNLPEQQTPRDYGVGDVVVLADRAEQLAGRAEQLSGFASALSDGFPLDPEAIQIPMPGWPSSAGVVKTYADYFQDQRPATAPLVPSADEMKKKIKRKKSDLGNVNPLRGIKGVKDSIRDIGRGTRSRLTSFGSKKSDSVQGDSQSSERSHAAAATAAVAASGYVTSPETINQHRPYDYGGSHSQRREFNGSDSGYQPWAGRVDRRPATAGVVATSPGYPSSPELARSNRPNESQPQRREFNGVESGYQPWERRMDKDPATVIPLSNGVAHEGPYRGHSRRGEAPAPTMGQRRIKHPTGSHSVAGASPSWRMGYAGEQQWEQVKPNPPPNVPTYGTAL